MMVENLLPEARRSRHVSLMLPLILALAALLLPAIFLLPGCDKGENRKADKLTVAGDSTLCGKLDSLLENPIRFTVHAKKEKTFLGGSVQPVAKGARLAFRLLLQPDNAGAELSSAEAVSDAGGNASVNLKIGVVPGVYIVEASLPDCPGVKPCVVTVLGGVAISGDRQDGVAGGWLEKPLAVTIEAKPGIPYEGAIARFDLRLSPDGTALEQEEPVSDDDGSAATRILLGRQQGRGEVGIRIIKGPFAHDVSDCTLTAHFFVMDYYSLAINVLGGLAIFIFGMRLMSEGLSLVAGEKLRSLLNFLTNNRFAAVGVGLAVTGIIQSSSACTVMVIGFVNAGLMRLEQAIGVIMGANIGTTVTAQMISFRLDSLALPAVAAGVVASLLAKRSRTRFAAQILIGFGILFLGMGMMAGPLKELKDCDTIRGLFAGLNCAPVDGHMSLAAIIKSVAAGTLMTMIVQSSSATVGLLLALAGAGLLDIYTSFPILLGDNIGTTITAVLAAIGSSRTAKRAACAHCLFNITGTIIMIALLFVQWPGTGHPAFMELVSRMTDGDNFGGENLPRFLANAHTMFNVSCTVCFVGFVGVFARACRLIIPGDEPQLEGGRGRLLDPRLLSTPAIAIQQTWKNLDYMLAQSRIANDDSFKALLGSADPDWDSIAESVRAHEKDTDRLQTEITEYLSGISMEALTESQSEQLPRLLHSVNDIERIGDHGMSMLRLAKRVRKRSLPFTEDAVREIREMSAGVNRLFDLCGTAVRACASGGDASADPASKALLEEAKHAAKLTKKQASDFRKGHEFRHEQGSCDIRSGVVFLDVILNLNRTAGHLLNIIQAALEKGPIKTE